MMGLLRSVCPSIKWGWYKSFLCEIKSDNLQENILQLITQNSNSHKESACDAGDPGSIPGSRRSSGEGNGNPLQYSCLENSMDRGAWWATFHGIARVKHDLVTNYHYLGQITTRYKANTAVRDCLVQTSS